MEMLTPPQSGIGEIEFERYTRLTFGQLQSASDSMTRGHSVGGEHLHEMTLCFAEPQTLKDLVTHMTNHQIIVYNILVMQKNGGYSSTKH